MSLSSRLILGAALVLAVIQPARAGIYLVTETYDAADANLGDGLCADASGRCTLRAAVQESNADSGPSFIMLPAGTYRLSIPGDNEHAAATGDLDLLGPVTLRGQGPDRTIIDAAGIDRAFEGIFAGTVVIRDLSIENGVAGANTPGFAAARSGGAIAVVGNDSTLTLQNVVLRNNRAQSGGALYNVFSTVEIQDSTFHDNAATVGSGGGIAEGVASLTRLYNVTLSANRAAQNGGGMATSNNTALLYNVTLTGNLADSDGDGSGDGGGLYQGIAAPALRNSIVAGNGDTGGEAPDCAGALVSNGYNLIGTDAGCGIAPAPGDQIGGPAVPIDAGLQGLEVAGNGLPAHALSTGSPAVDAGNPAVPGSGGDACLATDARGADRTRSTPCDIGAYERAESGLTLQVTSFIDAVDAAPGDGICETAPGNQECTLRAAIQEANALGGMDTILLPPGTFELALAGAGENNAASGDLDVTDGVRIRGAGMAETTIDGGGLDRVFDLIGPHRIEIQGLTVRNGAAGAGNGGGILLASNSALDLVEVRLTGNSAQSGGGLYALPMTWMNDGLVSLTRCVIDANTADLYGGGFANFTFRSSKIVDSVLSGNRAQLGGGLFNSLMAMALVTGSTISDNQAETGGGIGLLWGRGVVTLVNSTLSGNTATLAGGGISVPNTDTVKLFSTTVTANRVTGAAGGGGIHGVGRVELANTVLAGNLDDDGLSPECAATLTSLGHNFIGSDAGCTIAAAAGDRIGTAIAPLDARLDVLASQGGSPAYHQPLADSPLLDAGNAAMPGGDGAVTNCPATDQRGVDRQLNAACDIGAVELRTADLVLGATASSTSTPVGSELDYLVQITNTGPDTATDVTLGLTAPAATAYANFAGTGWTCAASADGATCRGMDLPAGASSDLTLTLVSSEGVYGTLSATLEIATASRDLDSDNDRVQLDTVVAAYTEPSEMPDGVDAEPSPVDGGISEPLERLAEANPEVPSAYSGTPGVRSGNSRPSEETIEDAQPAELVEPPAEDYAFDAETTAAGGPVMETMDSSISPPTDGMSPDNGVANLPSTRSMFRAGVSGGSDPPGAGPAPRPLRPEPDGLAQVMIASAEFWNDVAAMREQMAVADAAESGARQQLVLETAKALSVFVFAGATNWYLKGSSLLASLLSSMPLWTPFDPLPILALNRRTKRRRLRAQATAAALEDRYSTKLTRLLDRTTAGADTQS